MSEWSDACWNGVFNLQTVAVRKSFGGFFAQRSTFHDFEPSIRIQIYKLCWSLEITVLESSKSKFFNRRALVWPRGKHQAGEVHWRCCYSKLNFLATSVPWQGSSLQIACFACGDSPHRQRNYASLDRKAENLLQQKFCAEHREPALNVNRWAMPPAIPNSATD